MSETNEVQAECADGLAAASKSVTAADDPRLVQALEEYANAVEAGNRPNRKEFQDRYPDVAAALAECLEGLEFVQAAAPQLAHPAAGRPPRAAATAEFWPADPLGDFRIIAEIGRGGMGVVYEVMQVSLGRRVALKVLPFAAALDAKQLQRFKNEAQAAAQLHHQNIVPVYGLGCERGVHYYAMQYIDGQTLAALIGELRSLSGLGQPEALPVTLAAASLAADLVSGRWAPALHTDVASVERNSFRLESARLVAERNEFRSTKEIDSSTRPTITAETSKRQTAAVTENSTKSPAFFRTAASLAMQAATALEHAHALGVIHRDVKPANLLVDARGHLWITDFGLAHCQSQAGLTMTGDLMGTLRYMSPEQSLGQRVLLDHRTDIYSLGATLYELLTLEPVFDGRDRQELLRQIANDEPRRPRSLNHAIPVELETIVLKAMEKNPADRYATAQHMADDLQRYLKDEPIRARPPTLAEKTRKWMRRHSAVVRTALAMLSLSVVAVAVVATAAAWRLEREQKATSDQLYLTQQAEAEATLRLYRSLVEQARANRLTRRMGQRFKSLDLLAEATKHAHVMNLPDNDLLELRNEAVACLALTDVRGVGETWPFPTNGRGWVAYNPQQKRYACDQDGGSIAVYEVAGRQAAVAFHNLGPDAHCVDLRFSPDGRFLMANYRFHLRLDARVCVWKAHLAEAFQLILNEDANSAAFSPDGHSLAVGQTNGSIAIHSLAGGEVKRLEGSFHARNMAVHPGGGQLALSAWDGWHARLIDADTGRELATFAHDSEIHALDFSRDGRLLAVGCDDRKTYVWDVPQRRLQAVLEGHEKRVWSVAFSPRDELLATSARDGTTRFWDPVDGRPLVTAPGELLG
ncbi:MAG TPA: serine/threonine-protein kinase, partial [Pirellulales bacterium]|nr:serine/threonine-protein kinase [Pirellulales bacterium]